MAVRSSAQQFREDASSEREFCMRLRQYLLTAIPLLGAVLFGQSSGQ